MAYPRRVAVVILAAACAANAAAPVQPSSEFIAALDEIAFTQSSQEEDSSCADVFGVVLGLPEFAAEGICGRLFQRGGAEDDSAVASVLGACPLPGLVLRVDLKTLAEVLPQADVCAVWRALLERQQHVAAEAGGDRRSRLDADSLAAIEAWRASDTAERAIESERRARRWDSWLNAWRAPLRLARRGAVAALGALGWALRRGLRLLVVRGSFLLGLALMLSVVGAIFTEVCLFSKI